jgi:hypothetical protein
MTKTQKIQKAKIVAISLLAAGVLLETASILTAFIVGEPYKNVCPAEVSAIPRICIGLSFFAFVAALTAFFVSLFTRPKSFIALAGLTSIVLMILIIFLMQIILVESGFGLNWCDYRF